MRKMAFAVLAMLSTYVAYGQSTMDEYRNILLRSHNVETETRYEDVDGHPFSDKDMKEGEIHLTSGRVVDNLQMRYNWYTSQMEILEDESVYSLPKSAEIDFVIIAGIKYVPFYYHNLIAGYAVEVYSDECSLYRKEEVILIPGEEPVSSYDEYKPPRFFTSKPEYFLICAQGSLTRLEESKRNIINQLEPFDDELKDFVKEEKLRLKDEFDLIRLIEFYNSLLEG